MIYVFGDYALDTHLYELRRGGEPCPLGPQVFNVLAYLIAHRDRVVTKDELIEHLWPAQFVSDATVHQHVTSRPQGHWGQRTAATHHQNAAQPRLSLYRTRRSPRRPGSGWWASGI